MSSRSEDEVFSDAATEFEDSGFSSGAATEFEDSGLGSGADKDLTSFISFKDCEDKDILPSPQNSADGSQKEISNQKSMPILPICTPDNHDIGLICSQDSEDKNGSASDVASIETEMLICVPKESREVCAAACSVVQPDDVIENGESKLNENLSSDSVLPSKLAFKISETESISEKGPNVTSDMVELKEEFSDRLSSKTSMSGNVEQEIDGKGNSGVSFHVNLMDASIKSDNTEVLTSADKIVEIEENSDKLALIDHLSTKAESAKGINVFTDTFDIQTDAAYGMDSSIDIDSNEADDKKEKEKESVYVLSVPDDFSVLDDAEIKLQGFKDHKRVKLPQSDALSSEEIILDMEDQVKHCVSQEKFDTFLSNPTYKDIITEGSYKLDGINEAIDEEKLVGGNADMIQIDKGSSAWTPVAADTIMNEKDQELGSLTEQQPVYVADDLHQTGFPVNMIDDVPDAKLTVTDADVEAPKLSNVVGDKNYAKHTGTTCESTMSSSLSHVNPASKLLEIEDSDDIRTRITENYDINEVESGDGPKEGYVSINTDCTSESIGTHYQSAIVTEEANETEGLQSDRVSNSQDDKNESKISSYNKVHGECVVEDRMVSAVDNSERNKFERTSVNHTLEKELIHAGAAAASRTSAVILQGEDGNGSFNPQHDTTVGDVLIETSSRTDSLEGHWGSISVLSTQSDNQAAMDTETLPSTGSQALSEAEKVNLKKSKVASEEEHLDKFDKFEPPSFMTLVEHGGSDRKAVGVSETPGAENPRAGWFPSLTHMGNESQGRKKNEEIIEKVANWNANQHSALRKLADSEAKPKSPNSNQNPNPVVLGAKVNSNQNPNPVVLGAKVNSNQNPNPVVLGAKVNSNQNPNPVVLGAKVNSNQNPNPVVLGAKVKSTEAEPTNVEAEKEWESPASDIKREKRKVKGRPFWVQFACCSSVN